MSYKHRVSIQELPTPIYPVRRISAAIPFVVGTAPVLDPAGPVESPELIYSYEEFVNTFNWDDGFADYTLCEFAKVFFSHYRVGPAVFVNVLDPAVHKANVLSESKTLANDKLTLDNNWVLTGEVVKDATDTTTYVKDTDYSIDYKTGVITRIATGTIGATDTLHITYDHLDPSAVLAADIIGGIDGSTGTKTGLELVAEVFPRFRIVPGLLASPGWSHDATVAVAMAAKADAINTLFKALAVVDLPTSVTKYSVAPTTKNTNNLTDSLHVVCWPQVAFSSTENHWLSSHLCGLMAATDADHFDVPYKSPSNERLTCVGAKNSSTEIWLGPSEAEYLNGQGIVTALNFIGGWRAWGNRTGAYPSQTDVKDVMLPVRRMFNWIGNTVILTAWQDLDDPITRRNVETVVDSLNVWLNGLTAREMILGGRVAFLPDENPYTDIIDGIIKFHLWVTPPSPAREIDFIVQYDPDYVATLFGGQ